MLKLRGMQSTLLLPSLPGPFWPGVVAPEFFEMELFFFYIETVLTRN